MRKILAFYLLCLSITYLEAFVIKENNLTLDIETTAEYAKIISDNTIKNYQTPGEPAIPLKTIFFRLDKNRQILNINIKPCNSENIKLTKQLFPVQKAYPLTKLKTASLTKPKSKFYKKPFPETFLHNFGSGFCTSTHIGYVTLFSARYLPQTKELIIPKSFEISIQTKVANQQTLTAQTTFANKVLNQVGLEAYKKNQELNYMLITPDIFSEAYQKLLEWRYLTGVNTYLRTMDEIETYPGIDTQAKIRNCIIDCVENYNIDFVTLGAGVEYIPDRKLFAFDCEYGAYEDENDLPGDIYYSCLDGNWDANNNQIYGEDTDEVDYFPDVAISRIPATTATQVTDYITKLIEYESGNYHNYNKACGFSMALWEGSDSQVCQQYIYEQYFPDYFDINFIYGFDNTETNAFSLLNENQNIVQHTGHAGTQVLCLEEGGITNANCYQLNNDYGGILYSIGCWSAAIDYESIGEKLVKDCSNGFLSYIGNSRYGWGAPSASGFGFSEFFQKEFFANFFVDNISTLAMGNALQKVPFIPYFNGTSVYKWVAYELNALGDSYLNIFSDNPDTLFYQVTTVYDSIQFKVFDNENKPIENAYVTNAEIRKQTNHNGIAYFQSLAEDNSYIYKYGYYLAEITPQQINIQPSIENTSELESYTFTQNSNLQITSTLHNPTFMQYDFEVAYEYNPEELEISYSENPNSILDFASVALSPVDITIKSIEDSYQMKNGKQLYFREKIIDTQTAETITSATFIIEIEAPELKFTSMNFSENSLEPNSTVNCDFTLFNQGSIPAEDILIGFQTDSEYLSFSDTVINIPIILNPDEFLNLSNFLNINADIPEDYAEYIDFDFNTDFNELNYAFNQTLFLPIGNIGYFSDFENNFNWSGNDEWQTVTTYAYEDEYSLSCRPQLIGNYEITSPAFIYLPGLNISFQYKYKMPMYGEDGFYLLFESGSVVDTLLFLGAGGALPKDAYIESDWAEYNINLDETLLELPEMGNTFNLSLNFKFAEIIPNFNEYGTMHEIGVFIDNLKLESTHPFVDGENDNVSKNSLKIYPNPINLNYRNKLQFSIKKELIYTGEIFNLKGKSVKKLDYNLSPVRNMNWNLKDKYNKTVSSGIYFIKIQTKNRNYQSKFTIIK